jgi:hypothetical protein
MSYNLDEKQPARRPDFDEEEQRPTIVRPAYRPGGPLFPGWGPRI